MRGGDVRRDWGEREREEAAGAVHWLFESDGEYGGGGEGARGGARTAGRGGRGNSGDAGETGGVGKGEGEGGAEGAGEPVPREGEGWKGGGLVGGE